MIHISRTLEGIEKEVDRLADGPTAQDLLHFENILQIQFIATQYKVHKITRSLQLSGKVDSKHENDKWEGEITYGGPSAGVNNPVDYAEYERERDGSHDFLKATEEFESGYVHAMKAFFEG
jgi:hypothetical protein